MDLQSLLFLISYFVFFFFVALVITAFKKVKKRIKREQQIDEILDHLTN